MRGAILDATDLPARLSVKVVVLCPRRVTTSAEARESPVAGVDIESNGLTESRVTRADLAMEVMENLAAGLEPGEVQVGERATSSLEMSTSRRE